MATAIIVALATVVAVAFGVLALARTLEATGGVPGVLRRVRDRGRPRQVNLWHMALGLAVLGALFLLANSPAGLLARSG